MTGTTTAQAAGAPHGRLVSMRKTTAWVAIPLGALAVILAARLLPAAFETPVLDRMPAIPAATAALLGGDARGDPAGFAHDATARLNAYWRAAFPAMGLAYRPPVVNEFPDAVSLPCFPLMDFNDGPPYYCFLDDTIYLPQQYVADLAAAPGVNGALAVAYGLAHEFAHHVQHLTALGAPIEDQQAKPGTTAARQALVHYELQGDCLAGLWLRTVVPPTSVDQAQLAAAQTAAIEIHGPEGGAALDTHGTLAQRHQAVWAGFRTGRGSACEDL